MDERKAGNPIPTQAIRDLIQRMITDGRPIEEQCTVQILPPLIIQADHKDTTEPQRKFVKQKCERCNMYALPGFNRCKYHTDPMSPTENIVTT